MMHRSAICRWLVGLLFLLFACGATPVEDDSGQDNRIDPQKIVAAHNSWRAQVGVTGLRWSPALEARAIVWANELKKNGCFMEHSGPGENLFWASPRQTAVLKEGNNDWLRENSLLEISEQLVVDSWASEEKWFTPGTNDCNAPAGETCSHYTQLVWRTTTEVGCSKAICADHSQVWVCNYDPPGNIIGRQPY